jgi:phosphatidylglycerol:prolipoprotein diacylglycerol transferase
MEYIFETDVFSLRWYSFLVAMGLLAGAWLATVEARRRGDASEHVYNQLLLALPLALIGARAYHVIDEWNAVYSHDVSRVFLINEGGIGIYGAVAGSILAVVIYTRWKKLSFSRWMDIGAPGLLLGQVIGRWGNFFNQELYGRPTSVPWAIEIPPERRMLGYEQFSEFHPLFFYESMLNVLGVVVMLVVARRFSDRLKGGDIALMYGFWYGTVRLGLETLRIGNWTVGDVPTATVISALAVAGCGGALIYRHWWSPRKGPKAKTGQPSSSTPKRQPARKRQPAGGK